MLRSLRGADERLEEANRDDLCLGLVARGQAYTRTADGGGEVLFSAAHSFPNSEKPRESFPAPPAACPSNDGATLQNNYPSTHAH